MTPDPILTLSAVCAALSLAGLYLVVRLRAAESMIYDLRFDRLADNRRMSAEIATLQAAVVDLRVNERTFALDLVRTADDLTDLRAEYLAQTRALDAHDDRLVALEETKS